MNRALVMMVYATLVICGVIAIIGFPSPALEKQGGGVLTLIWSSLCVVAGCVGIVSASRRLRPWWEILAALIGASAAGTWTASLILQGVGTETLDVASATCMGAALTALLVHRARRLGGKT